MSLKRKIALGKNVLEAAQERVQWIFDTFEQITLSSGGKDSTALFHLVAAQARKQHRKI